MKGSFFPAGPLKWRLSLARSTIIGDGMGGEGTKFVKSLGFFFGYIELQKVESVFIADQIMQRVTHHITLRYQSKIKVKVGMMLFNDIKTFNILSVFDPDESERYLVCLTQEEKDEDFYEENE